MGLLFGIGFICLAIFMIWLARPADGDSAAMFKKSWVIGQLYVMATLLVFVTGAAYILN